MAIEPEFCKLFKGCTTLKTVDFNNSFGGKLTDISGMFEGCTSLTVADLTGLDLCSCEKAVKTFKDCTKVMEANLTGTDFGKLKDASEFFAGCIKLTNPNLSEARWNASLEKTNGMFSGDNDLTEITIPADFPVGGSCTDMFKLSEETKLTIKGSPSSTFINRALMLFMRRMNGKQYHERILQSIGSEQDQTLFPADVYN